MNKATCISHLKQIKFASKNNYNYKHPRHLYSRIMYQMMNTNNYVIRTNNLI